MSSFLKIENREIAAVCKVDDVVVKERGWKLSKKGKKKRFFVTQHKKNPTWAGWLKRLGLVRATPWADFAVIGVQLCLTMTAIFPCVALFYKN